MIKKLLTLIVLCSLWIPLGCEEEATGAVYYVKTGGNDNLDGLSDGNAWATIAKVEASSFSPGDSVLFNKGDSWSTGDYFTFPSSGAKGNLITIGAYGSGNKPEFQDSVALFTSKNYIKIQGLDVWSTATRPAILIEGGEGHIIENCDVDGKNHPQYGIIVSYDTNSDTWLQDVIIRNNTIVDTGIVDDDTYGAIQIAKGSRRVEVHDNTTSECEEFGIQTFSSNADWIVEDVYIHDNTISSSQTDTTRGINIGFRSKNVIVERNMVTGSRLCYSVDALITEKNYLRNNIAYDGVELCVLLANSNGNCNNAQVLNNTFIAGPNTLKGIWFRTLSGGTQTGHVLKNNIVDGSNAGSAVFREELIIEDDVTVDSDYNIFYDSNGELIDYQGTEYTDDFAGYQAASGLDANSLTSDPTLDSNYRLIGGSPAINAGTDVGITLDYIKNLRTSPFDIGAYEYCTTLKNCIILGATIL